MARKISAGSAASRWDNQHLLAWHTARIKDWAGSCRAASLTAGALSRTGEQTTVKVPVMLGATVRPPRWCWFKGAIRTPIDIVSRARGAVRSKALAGSIVRAIMEGLAARDWIRAARGFNYGARFAAGNASDDAAFFLGTRPISPNICAKSPQLPRRLSLLHSPVQAMRGRSRRRPVISGGTA